MLQDLHFIHFVIIYLVAGLAYLIFAMTLMHVIYQKKSPSTMLAWLLGIIFLPYVVIPLYFILGNRKRKSAYLKPQMDLKHLHPTHEGGELLLSDEGHTTSSNNQVTLFSDGVEAYEALMDKIVHAKQSICLSTYVFKDDVTTQALMSALIAKLDEGVRVKVMIDTFGSLKLYFMQGPLRALKEHGAEVTFFMPLLRMPFRNYINLRNHRKIYLIDDRYLFSGGMNLSDEYLGREHNPERFQDVLFMLEGDAVYHFYRIFLSDFNYTTGQDHSDNFAPIIEPSDTDDQTLQVVPSGPDVESDAVYDAILRSIFLAKKRIWIVTPYFVPDETIMRALLMAHKRGVDIKLITPKASNHLIADLARSPYMKHLYNAGVELWLYEKAMLHAKAMLVDEIAMVGSLNMDLRSLFLNYEVVAFFYSPESVQRVESWMQELMKDSTTQYQPSSKFREFFENFMRIFAPLI